MGIRNEHIVIKQRQHFYRMFWIRGTNEELANYFVYELPSQSTSRFDGVSIRKQVLVHVSDEASLHELHIPPNAAFAIAGGYLYA